MALDITTLRQAAHGAMYVSPERLYVTAAGEVCGADDERLEGGGRLLVGKGGSIPAREAAKYGLIADASEAAVLAEAAATVAGAAETEIAGTIEDRPDDSDPGEAIGTFIEEPAAAAKPPDGKKSKKS